MVAFQREGEYADEPTKEDKLRTAVLTVTLLLAGSASAQNSTKWVGRYFCKASASQGFSFNSQVKDWKGATFRTKNQFILSVTQATKTDRQVEATTGEAGQYVVTLAELGESKAPSRCQPEGHFRYDDKTPVTAYDQGFLICKVTFSTFKMSLSSMRYMSAYLQGYVDGADNDDNTPYIEIGTCARLE